MKPARSVLALVAGLALLLTGLGIGIREALRTEPETGERPAVAPVVRLPLVVPGAPVVPRAPLVPGAPVVPAEPADPRLQWVRIPEGRFRMGCTPGDPDCDADEKPPHAVRVTKPFEMAVTETTNAQYLECVKAGACWSRRDPSHPLVPDSFPVAGFDWGQAKTFCEWAGGRLPTEAEWEYAARGGKTGLRYPSGHLIGYDEATFGATTLNSPGGASPVRSGRPNGFGLFDMAGNAWEWCEDWYERGSYATSPSDDPHGPATGQGRVIRGGSWFSYALELRVSNRQAYSPATSLDTVGFRCARDVATP